MSFIDIENINCDIEKDMTEYHSHSFYELYYLIEGNRNYYIGSELYHIESGALVIVPPYMTHKTEGGTFKRYLISFEKSYLYSEQLGILDILESQKVIIFNKEYRQLIVGLLTIANEEYNNKLDNYKDIILSQIITLLCYGIRYGITKEKSCLASSSKSNHIINKVMEYINNNLDKKLSVDVISDVFYISKSHLSRLFKAVNNQSITQYITIARINKATSLLKTTSLSMQEIAELVGLNNSNYMNYIFKKNLNISPVKYRQNMANI